MSHIYNDANFWKCLLTEKKYFENNFFNIENNRADQQRFGFFCKIWRLQLHSIASDAKNLFRTRISNLNLTSFIFGGFDVKNYKDLASDVTYIKLSYYVI